MSKKILILGGYGGTGKHIAKHIVKYFNLELVIGGRNLEKCLSFKEELLSDYPNASLDIAVIDASNKKSLSDGFRDIDVVIVTATVPDHIPLIAEAALENQCDLIDILIRGDVVSKLSKFENKIKEQNQKFITQCGFHPGLITPLIRYASSYFDEYQEAILTMAMDGVFEKPEAIREIIFEVIESNALVLEDGTWRKASFKDSVKFQFDNHFGYKECYPAQMREIYELDKELGLKNCAVYASGFNSYIDRFIFPLAVVIGFFSKKLSQSICSKLFYNNLKGKIKYPPKAHLVLNAEGVKEDKERKITLSLLSDNSFELTAFAIIALLNQYLDNEIEKPGLYIMGKVLDENRVMNDLMNMGVEVEVQEHG